MEFRILTIAPKELSRPALFSRFPFYFWRQGDYSHSGFSFIRVRYAAVADL